jgi:hypothetical protein
MLLAGRQAGFSSYAGGSTKGRQPTVMMGGKQTGWLCRQSCLRAGSPTVGKQTGWLQAVMLKDRQSCCWHADGLVAGSRVEGRQSCCWHADGLAAGSQVEGRWQAGCRHHIMSKATVERKIVIIDVKCLGEMLARKTTGNYVLCIQYKTVYCVTHSV